MTDLHDNFKSQDNLKKQILWLIAIATFSLVGILFLQWKNHTESEVQELRKEVQAQTKTLETIQLSLETLNTSMLQIKRDTILVKEVDD